jgi:signal transduction histidine kinase
MMALYYAQVVSSQTALEQEARRHRETESQLRDATEQVERATRARSEFLARMSHELRNPLNAIIGYSELLIGDVPTNGDQKSEDLKSIKGAGYKLLGLVNDLLDLAKLEAGKLELHLEQFDLADFVDDLVLEWRPQIVANANELQVNCSPELGNVVGDVAKLRRAVGSLLSNAAKFTKRGRVTVTVSIADNLLVISVQDTGIGMDREQSARVFETFGASNQETSSNYGDNAGLGLPLTHRLCRLMGGDLAVESNPGRGSRSTIRVPFRPTSADEQLTVRDGPAVLGAVAA